MLKPLARTTLTMTAALMAVLMCLGVAYAGQGDGAAKDVSAGELSSLFPEGIPDGAFAPGELVVKMKPSMKKDLDVSSARFGVKSLDEICSRGKVKKISPVFPSFDPEAVAKRNPRAKEVTDLSTTYLVKVDKYATMMETLGQLRLNPNVEYTEPNLLVEFHSNYPNDPYYQDTSHSWGQHSNASGFSGAKYSVPERVCALLEIR